MARCARRRLANGAAATQLTALLGRAQSVLVEQSTAGSPSRGTRDRKRGRVCETESAAVRCAVPVCETSDVRDRMSLAKESDGGVSHVHVCTKTGY